MANQNALGQFQDEVEQAATEVAGDVKDSVGELIEQGAQSVSGPTLTPQQLQAQKQDNQQKEIERQNKIARTRDWLSNIDVEQAKERMKNKQKEEQRLQAQNQEEQNKKTQAVQIQQTGKVPGKPIRADIAESMPEIRAGKGKVG